MKLLVAVTLLLTTSAWAQEPAGEATYQDDRSGATALIQSFYNAINRHEYTRAFSYYGPVEGDPTEAFAAFEAGYTDTDFVTLLTGDETSEGAAGSTYTTVPVAIDALGTDGTHRQFAGCYTLRLSDPANQTTPPYQPLHIEAGTLEEASGELSTLLPTSCAG